MYEIYPSERDSSSTYSNEFFDIAPYPNATLDEVVKINILDTDNLDAVEIIRHKEFISEVIKQYIELSPIKTVAVLFRLQGRERETILGVYHINDFIKKLSENKILYNVAYLVAGEGEEALK